MITEESKRFITTVWASLVMKEPSLERGIAEEESSDLTRIVSSIAKNHHHHLNNLEIQEDARPIRILDNSFRNRSTASFISAPIASISSSGNLESLIIYLNLLKSAAGDILDAALRANPRFNVNSSTIPIPYPDKWRVG